MELRNEKLLKAIIELHIKTARPVGSKVLAEAEHFGVSPATIRNDMLDLEAAGYITQPHTSAGRVPTIKGYRYYVDNLLSIETISDKDKQDLVKTQAQDIRSLAKWVVAKTNLAVIIGFAPNDLYFTGLFNLFSQPEFEDYKMVLSMSHVVDSFEKGMNSIYHQIDKPQVLLGGDNPFSDHCAAAVTPLTQDRILAILGPVRMDYNQVLGLLDEVVKTS